jgi:hypothetical protein
MVYLIEILLSRSRVAEDYEHAAFYTLFLVGFFAATDLFIRLRRRRKSSASNE